MEADDVAVVLEPHDEAAPVRIGGTAALDTVLMGDEVLVVEAEAAIKLVVVEQKQPGAGVAVDFDVAFDLVSLVAYHHQ